MWPLQSDRLWQNLGSVYKTCPQLVTDLELSLVPPPYDSALQFGLRRGLASKTDSVYVCVSNLILYFNLKTTPPNKTTLVSCWGRRKRLRGGREQDSPPRVLYIVACNSSFFQSPTAHWQYRIARSLLLRVLLQYVCDDPFSSAPGTSWWLWVKGTAAIPGPAIPLIIASAWQHQRYIHARLVERADICGPSYSHYFSDLLPENVLCHMKYSNCYCTSIARHTLVCPTVI